MINYWEPYENIQGKKRRGGAAQFGTLFCPKGKGITLVNII